MFSTQGSRLTTRLFASLSLATGAFAAGCADPATAVVDPLLSAQAQSAVLFPAGVASLQAQTTLAVGASAQMRLSWPFVSWRRNVYRSRNANVASVSSSGRIMGVANGRTYVVVTFNTLIDSSLVVVGTGQALTVQPMASTVQIGATQQLTVSGGSGVTYVMEDPTIASVSSTGLIRAVGAGNSLVGVHVTGQNVVIATVTVPMSFASPTLSVVVGATAQIALGALGVDCANGVRTYSVAAPTVATVTAAGVVTGVAAGSTTVSVNAGTCSGTLPITVTALSGSGPAPANAVAVNLQRFAGVAGAVSFSNGIPLPPGQLRSTALVNVRLFLAGTEQPLFVRALGGLHPDGSLRSVHIQGRVVAPAAGGSIQGYMTFDTPRTAGNLAQAGNPTTLEAAVLPTSQAFLVSTEAGGKMITAAQVAAGTANMRAQDADFETMAPQIFAKFPCSWARDQSIYEHVLSHYQRFLQTADPKWYQMAWCMGQSYQSYFLTAGNYPNEWASTAEGLTVHYWMTGDEKARTVVGNFTEWFTGGTENIYKFDVADGYVRFKGRSMLTALDCLKIECNPGVDKYKNPYTTPYNLRTILPSAVVKIGPTVTASGFWPGTYNGGGQKNFMVGIQLTALARYYDELNADPAILPLVKKSLDFMMANEFDVATQGLRYCSINFGDCNMVPQPGLNNVVLPAFAWYYSKTRDPKYLAYADQLFAGSRPTRTNWVAWPKQFDQAMYRVVNYYFWRQ